MTTKTPRAEPQRPVQPQLSPQEMQAALQAHTLAQMLYGRLLMGAPRTAQPMPTQAGYANPELTAPQPMWNQAFGPAMVPPYAPPTFLSHGWGYYPTIWNRGPFF